MYVSAEVTLVAASQNRAKKKKNFRSGTSKTALIPTIKYFTPDYTLVKKAGDTDCKDLPTSDWRVAGLNFAATCGEAGRALFIAFSMNNTGWEDTIDELNAYYDYYLDQADPDKASKKKLYDILMKHGVLRKEDLIQPFWWMGMKSDDEGTEPELFMSPAAVIDKTLPSMGYRITRDGDHVQIESGSIVISNIKILHMKQSLVALVNAEGEEHRDALIAFLLKSANMPTKDKLESLKMVDLKYLRSTREYIYFPLQDVVMRLHRETREISKIDYDDLDGFYVMKESIIPVKFDDLTMERAERSVAKRYVYDVSATPEQLIWLLGYLADDFMDPANARAVFITDEKAGVDGVAYGGTGKDLLIKLLTLVRKPGTRMSGKKLNVFRAFAFQSLIENSRYCWIEDLRSKTDEEPLYTFITGPMEYEKKHKDEKKIPFEDTFKWVISSNYILKNMGPSTERRFYVAQLKSLFTPNYGPLDKYGKRFFNDWDDEEWKEFYSFMLLSVMKTYLESNGPQKAFPEEFIRKQVIEHTSEDFVLWCDTQTFSDDLARREIKALRESFLYVAGQDSRRTIESNLAIFSKWLRTYVEKYLNMRFVRQESDGKVYFTTKTRKDD